MTPGGFCPFGNPRVERVFAPNRGLSQLVTSFIGFLCQGIHRLPLPSSLFPYQIRWLEHTLAPGYKAERAKLIRCDLLEKIFVTLCSSQGTAGTHPGDRILHAFSWRDEDISGRGGEPLVRF